MINEDIDYIEPEEDIINNAIMQPKRYINLVNIDEIDMSSTSLFDDNMIDHIEPVQENIKIKNKVQWVDKYRPKKLSQIIQQDEIIRVLNDSLKTGLLPHLLLHGPPGTGKTSTILSFAMELYGPKIFSNRVLELNASDERGIGVVRNKIITFAKSALGNNDPNYPCPPYKLIILDEADSMTVEAQSALRAVMESRSSITRFCFICNYVYQIIGPIASRCMKFRYKSITSDIMKSKLKNIMKKEKFNLGEDIMEKIIELSKGDIRSGITTLQYLKYIHNHYGQVKMKDIYETTNYLQLDLIEKLWNVIIRDDIMVIRKETLILKQSGYSVISIFEKLLYFIIKDKILSDTQKSSISSLISCTEKRLIDGSDEFIQLFNVLVHINGVYKGIIE
jgi:replication factor C subunit 2/4